MQKVAMFRVAPPATLALIQGRVTCGYHPPSPLPVNLRLNATRGCFPCGPIDHYYCGCQVFDSLRWVGGVSRRILHH